MTKKHFVLLAAALRSNVPSLDSNAYESELFENIVASISDACREVNPRFDRERFESACGMDAIRNQRGLRDAIEAHERRDFDGLVVADTCEIPASYSGDVLHINDHGNATLYAAARGRLVEIAGCA
jgi:hypothetical protein